MFAILASGHSNRVTLTDLEKVITPDRTKTWTPTPHHEIPKAIRAEMRARKWKFASSSTAHIWDISITPNHMKVFGVTEILIPGVSGLYDEFRNSHNKTLSVRLCLGTRVFVCDNLMMTGDFNIKREHTRKIKLAPIVFRAFDMIEEKAKRMGDKFSSMRDIKVGYETGNTLLLDAVNTGALPLLSLMEARRAYESAYTHNVHDVQQVEDINMTEPLNIMHGRSLWGWYQSVTGTWKTRKPTATQGYAKALNLLVQDRYSLDLSA